MSAAVCNSQTNSDKVLLCIQYLSTAPYLFFNYNDIEDTDDMLRFIFVCIPYLLL